MQIFFNMVTYPCIRKYPPFFVFVLFFVFLFVCFFVVFFCCCFFFVFVLFLIKMTANDVKEIT